MILRHGKLQKSNPSRCVCIDSRLALVDLVQRSIEVVVLSLTNQTFQASALPPRFACQERDSHHMEMSRLRPDKGSLGSPSTRHLSSQFSFITDSKVSRRPSTAPKDVAGVLLASYSQRLAQVATLRLSVRK